MPKWIFYCACPACPPGPNNKPSRWYHCKCGNLMYVWDDCDLGCCVCPEYHCLLDWNYICGSHRTQAKKPNIQNLLRAICVFAQMSYIPYKTWKVMEEKIEKEAAIRCIVIAITDD